MKIKIFNCLQKTLKDVVVVNLKPSSLSKKKFERLNQLPAGVESVKKNLLCMSAHDSVKRIFYCLLEVVKVFKSANA